MSRRKDRVKRPPGKPMVCPFCGYGSHLNPVTNQPVLWITRVETPKCCPECKGYLNRPGRVPGLKPMPKIEIPKGADKFIASISGNKNL